MGGGCKIYEPDVVVRVNADFFLLCSERKLAKRLCLELVVRLKVRPSPNTTVDDMRKAFAVRDLAKQKCIRRQKVPNSTDLKLFLPVVVRQDFWGLSRNLRAVPGNSRLSRVPRGPLFSSAFLPRHRQLFRPTFLPRRPKCERNHFSH
jgi:hypothetical protein